MTTPNMFADAIEALTDRQGELELRLDNLEVTLPFLREPVRLSGVVSVRVNLTETSPGGRRPRRRT